MTRVLSIVSLATLLTVSAMAAEARPARGAPKAAAKAEASAAIKTRAAAMTGFTTRMGRLDALMGASARTPRTRSADAER